MTTTEVRQLVKQLNALSALSEDQQTFHTSFEKSQILYKLASQSQKDIEQHYFIMQGIGILEAVNMALQNESEEDVDTTITEQNIIDMHVLLSDSYIVLAKNKKEDKFLDLSKKFIKKYAWTGEAEILYKLINICALKDEPAMCQHYMKKLHKNNSFNLATIEQMESLQKYHATQWYQENINR